MKFFNENITKKIIESIGKQARLGLFVGTPVLTVYGEYKDTQKRSEIFNKYGISHENPNNRYHYVHEEITCRGIKGDINGRIVDKETGEIVARCP